MTNAGRAGATQAPRSDSSPSVTPLRAPAPAAGFHDARAQNDAAEIKLRAERRLGELLAETTVKGGARHKSHDGTYERRPTLPPDVTNSQSSRWQAVAAVPEEKFEAFIQKERDRGVRR